MPIYRYRCTACDIVEEFIQKLSDPPMTTCAACSGELEKMLTTANPQFKGGGWYKDGYASAPAPADSPAGPKASDVQAGLMKAASEGGSEGAHKYLDKLENKS